MKLSILALAASAAVAAAAAGAPYTMMPSTWPKNYKDPKTVKTNSSLTLAGCEQVSETAHRPTQVLMCSRIQRTWHHDVPPAYWWEIAVHLSRLRCLLGCILCMLNALPQIVL